MTNPAIDPFREAIVTSLRCFIGPEGDITASLPTHARRLELEQPVLTIEARHPISPRPHGLLAGCFVQSFAQLMSRWASKPLRSTHQLPKRVAPLRSPRPPRSARRSRTSR